MSETTPRKLSRLLDDLQQLVQGKDHISLDDILLAFHERGFGVFLFFLALPMGLPIPVPPGVNVVLAMPLLFLTIQQAIGRHTPWFPEKLRHKNISSAKIMPMISAAQKCVGKIEILLRPRLGWVTCGVWSHVIGIAGFIMALSICVPLPLTNTVPSFGIAVMAAGVLMRDGMAVLAGMIIGLAWVGLLILSSYMGLSLFFS